MSASDYRKLLLESLKAVLNVSGARVRVFSEMFSYEMQLGVMVKTINDRRHAVRVPVRNIAHARADGRRIAKEFLPWICKERGLAPRRAVPWKIARYRNTRRAA